MWKIGNFSVTQFLREINFCESEGSKSAILTRSALFSEILVNFCIWLKLISRKDEWQKNLKFPHRAQQTSTEAQYENLRIFQPLYFLCEINVGHSRRSEFTFWLILAIFLGLNMPACAESLKLISRKIWVAEKVWNFHTVLTEAQYEYFRNLPPLWFYVKLIIVNAEKLVEARLYIYQNSCLVKSEW